LSAGGNMGISHVVRRLGLKKRGKEWWITDVPEYYVNDDGPYTECGPYDDKQDAIEDRDGMQRTLDKMEAGDYEPKQQRRKGQNSPKTVQDIIKEATPKPIQVSNEVSSFW